MSQLPYYCIAVVTLFFLGTFVVLVRTGGRILRRYFAAVRRFCSEQGLSIRDDPDRHERFIIEGELDGLHLRVSTARIEWVDREENSQHPVQRVEVEVDGPGWVIHRPLRTHIEERIVTPPLPEVGPAVATGDEDFDRELELHAAGEQVPAFTRIAWLRQALRRCNLELAWSHDGRVTVDFLEREVRDGPHDLHLLRQRILAALAVARPERAEQYRDRLSEPLPVPVDWSRVPLIALLLSLVSMPVGYALLDYPEDWMGPVVGAALGYPPLLLASFLGTWLWIRVAQRRSEERQREVER
jgi:hypothetical protein